MFIETHQPGGGAHAFNASTWDAEADRSLGSKPAWFTEQVPGYTEKNQSQKLTSILTNKWKGKDLAPWQKLYG